MTPEYQEKFLGNDEEILVQFCYQYLESHDVDYFIWGHRHIPLEIAVKNAIYFNTGDWLQHNSYVQYKEFPVLCYYDQ